MRCDKSITTVYKYLSNRSKYIKGIVIKIRRLIEWIRKRDSPFPIKLYKYQALPKEFTLKIMYPIIVTSFHVLFKMNNHLGWYFSFYL